MLKDERCIQAELERRGTWTRIIAPPHLDKPQHNLLPHTISGPDEGRGHDAQVKVRQRLTAGGYQESSLETTCC